MQYQVCGQGIPLLLIPGLDGTGELYYRQVPELAHDFQVVTFALRAKGDFTYEDLIDDLVRVIKELGSERVLICGESFGGTLALKFALAQPHLVERLIIINSFPYFRNRALLAASRVLLEFTPFELITAGRWIAAYLGLIAEDLPAEDRDKFLAITSRVPKLAVMRRIQLLWNFDLRNQLSQINIPTLLLASRRDRLQNSIAEAEYMAARIPAAKIHIIESMGHMPMPAPNCSLRGLLVEAGFGPK
ncbi:MAG: alpha/beta hydrolase [Acidobacteriota bacterium]